MLFSDTVQSILLHFVCFFLSERTYAQLDHPDPPLAFLGQTRRRTTPQKILPRQTGSAILSTCTGSKEKFTFPLDFSKIIGRNAGPDA